MDYSNKPGVCPKCGSHDVKRIMYGLPIEGHKWRDDEISGGCIFSEEEWHCGDCHWEWGTVGAGHYNI